MTVQELVEELKQFDPYAKVVIKDVIEGAGDFWLGNVVKRSSGVVALEAE